MNELDVRTIERDLTALWKKAGEEDGGVLRACLLNLLVYVPHNRAAREVEDIVSEITGSHPCRAILIIANRDDPDSYLKAKVTSKCTLQSASSKQVCCEQVTIEAGGEEVFEAPSAVAPLLLSDLPVYLWWRGGLQLGDRVFKRLADASDRVVIDSADFASPYGDLLSLAALMGQRHRGPAFSDLNWARLIAWRGLLAGFHDVARYKRSLENLAAVTVEYAPPAIDDGAIAPRALSLVGWLASRLGWTLNADSVTRSSSKTAFEFQTNGRVISVEFVATQNAAIEPGRLALVTLASATSGHNFVVRRSSDRTRIETEVAVDAERTSQRVLSYENWSEAELLGRELEILGHDRVYEEAVLAAGEMIVALVGS